MRILATGDIHVHDFSSFNISSDDFRLNQFTVLSYRLLEICAEFSCKAIVLAGDILHVASPRPKVVITCMRFLQNLAEYLPIYLTHGQHECDSRTLMSRSNTLVSLCNDIKSKQPIRYLHQEHVTIGNRTFYFNGWQPRFDYSKVAAADVLVTHATVQDALNARDFRIPSPQPFDNKKFKVVIAGDVHNPQEIDNIIIPGPPIGHNFGDPFATSVVVMDLDTLTYQRVPTATKKYPFLQFITAEGNPEPDNPYIIWKAFEASRTQDVERLRHSLSINETLEHYVKLHNLAGVHALVLQRISKIDLLPVDLLCKLKKITIKDFRSIDYFVYEIPEGLTRISGPNGAGKSTLMDAIRYVLFNHNTAKAYLRHGCATCAVSIELEYEGTEYVVTRGYDGSKGVLSVIINGMKQEAGGQQALWKKLDESLRFRSLSEIYWRGQNDGRFLSRMNYDARADFVSETLGINVLNKFAAVIDGMIAAESNKKLDFSRSITSLQGQLAALSAFDLSIAAEDIETQLSSVQAELDRLKQIKDARDQLNQVNNKLNEVKQVVADFAAIDDALIENKSDVLDQVVNLNTAITMLNRKLTDKLGVKAEHARELDRLDRVLKYEILDKLQESLVNLGKIKIGKCYVCGATLREQQKLQAQEIATSQYRVLSERQSSILADMRQLTELDTAIADELRQFNDDLTAYKLHLDRHNASLKSIETAELQKRFQRSTRERLAELSLQYDVAKQRLTDCPDDLDALYDQYTEARADLLVKLDRKQAALQTLDKIAATKARLETLQGGLNTVLAIVDKYTQYQQLVGLTGPVLRALLASASELMSDAKIRVRTQRSLASGAERPDFSMEMRVHDDWIAYNDLSGGQQVLCDIHIMRNLINISGGIGLLVLDETINSIYPDLLDEVMLDIKSINAYSILLVSHHDHVPNVDKQLAVRLVAGVSRYELHQ